MFSACTTPDVKESILQSFRRVDGLLRVVIASVAFGMGLDCPKVRRVIHWSPSQDMEQYMQETGRAGRDGLPSVAALYMWLMCWGNLTEETIRTTARTRPSAGEVYCLSTLKRVESSLHRATRHILTVSVVMCARWFVRVEYVPHRHYEYVA